MTTPTPLQVDGRVAQAPPCEHGGGDPMEKNINISWGAKLPTEQENEGGHDGA